MFQSRAEIAATRCDHLNTEQAAELRGPMVKTSDLKPEAQAKLEKSRQWLKDYFQRKPEQGT